MANNIADDNTPYKRLVKQAEGDVPNADAGGLNLFIDEDDDVLKSKDESGVVVAIGVGAQLLFEAKRTTNQALTADVTAIDFNSVQTNVGSAWASGVFTAPADGLYMITINLCMTAATAYVLRGYVNGTAKVDGRYSSPGDQRHQAVFLEYLTAGDTFEARISASLTMDGSDAKFNWCRIVRLS